MSYRLTPRDKRQCKIIFMMLVVSQLLKEVEKRAKTEGRNPAIENCVKVIDEILKDRKPYEIEAINARVDTYRLRLTKRIKSYDIASALIGCLRTLTSGFVKTKKATEIDFVITQFRKNLPDMEQYIPFREDQAKKAGKHFKELTLKI